MLLFNIIYAAIDLVSRMINIGKLVGKGEDEIRPIDGFIYLRPERINHARDVSRDHAAFYLAPVKLSLYLSCS